MCCSYANSFSQTTNLNIDFGKQELDYSTINVGCRVSRTIHLLNNTGAVCEVNPVIKRGDFFTLSSNSSVTIEDMDAYDFDINFDPLEIGDVRDTIVFEYDNHNDSIIVTGNAYYSTENNAGNSISFDGSEDFVNIGTFTNLTKKSFSLEMWINSTDNTTRSILWGSYSSSSLNSFNFELTDHGYLRTYLDGKNCYDDENVADGNWHFVATVIDYENDSVYLYVDGRKKTVVSDLPDPYTVDNEYMLAKDVRNGSHFYKGNMDEVRLWSKALSQEEIQNHYASLYGNEDNLEAYYRFDGGSDNYVYDYTGNNHRGILSDQDLVFSTSTAPVGTPNYLCEPSDIDFGEIDINETDNSQIFTISNTGLGVLNLHLSSSDSEISLSPTSVAILSGESANVTVKITPNIVEEFTGSVDCIGNVSDQSVPITASITGTPTSIDNLDKLNISVFPNPVKDHLIINSSEEFVGSEYFIYALTGAVVVNGVINSNELNIDMGQLSSGIYTLSIILNQKEFTYKLVKK